MCWPFVCDKGSAASYTQMDNACAVGLHALVMHSKLFFIVFLTYNVNANNNTQATTKYNITFRALLILFLAANWYEFVKRSNDISIPVTKAEA